MNVSCIEKRHFVYMMSLSCIENLDSDQKNDLDRQVSRLVMFANSQKWVVTKTQGHGDLTQPNLKM
jgi:hypothetical protein